MHLYIIISYFIVWPIIMFGSAYFFYKKPQTWFNPNSFVFKEKSWEKSGKFYEDVFFIKKWKGLLPDGAALFKNGFKKRKMMSRSNEYFEKFILESCRAEATHLPPIFLSFLFALYNPPNIVAIMVVFGLVVNLPCILAQRYNRIRLTKLLNRNLDL
ncbi:MAG: hypothetical protein ACRCU3_07645 [Eubacteriaceae bacterium]